MNRRVLHAVAFGAALLATAACGDISSPGRVDRYEWRLVADSAPGQADTLSFHWPQSSVPVRFWAEDSLGLPDLVQTAIDRWKGAFLYHEWDGALVSDSASADVIVRAGPPDVPDVLAANPDMSSSVESCAGATDLGIVPPDLNTIHLPMHVFVSAFIIGGADLTDCLDRVTTHELGHTIGIFTHSPNATDVMYGFPQVSAPGVADRETVEALSHVQPTVQLAPR